MKNSRRQFIGATGAAILAAAVAAADDIGPQNGQQREEASETIRKNVAYQESDLVPIPAHTDNGDEALYPTKFANYSKALKHDSFSGEVDPAAYQALINAIETGRFSDFEALATNGHLGSADPSKQRRLVNPISGYAYDLEGTDSHQMVLPPAPCFASAQEAGEMVELYWMALLRDVPFAQYPTNPLAWAAAEDLSKLSDFRGPKQNGQVTPWTLFRDSFPGCTIGPYISQFLLQPANFGSIRIDTRMALVANGIDHMTDFQSWLDVQNGVNTPPTPTTGALSFCKSGRDLTHYVNIDQLYEAYFVAGVNLLSNGYLANIGNPYGQMIDGGAGRPRNPAIDPKGALAQVGFGTFGGPSILTLAAEPATRALKDVWYQKWLVHRRLRPEEFGGRVEVARLGRRRYPFHADLTKSCVLSQVFSKFGSMLLPMAFLEGSPNHTSYGSGHATVAGACVTMLKALFHDWEWIHNPVMPNPADGGQTLVPYSAPQGEAPMTVHGELNKLGSNIAQGRNIAGVHWRSDAAESMLLGEAATISMLRDLRSTLMEPFNGFTFVKFDGSIVTV